MSNLERESLDSTDSRRLVTLQAAYNGYYMLAIKLKQANELQAANAYAKSALKCLERVKALNDKHNNTTVLQLHLVKEVA